MIFFLCETSSCGQKAGTGVFLNFNDMWKQYQKSRHYVNFNHICEMSKMLTSCNIKERYLMATPPV